MLRRRLLLGASIVSGFAQFLLAAFQFALGFLLGSCDVNDDAALVHTRDRIDAVREVEVAGGILGDAGTREGMMRTPLGGLGTIATHSNYHISAIIQTFQR